MSGNGKVALFLPLYSGKKYFLDYRKVLVTSIKFSKLKCDKTK